MRLLAFYLRRSPSALSVATLLGLFSGLSAAALLVIINHMLQAGEVAPKAAATFLGLCILRLCTGVGSHIVMIRLSQSALQDLRIELASSSLHARLDHLERVGRARLAAGFGEDVLHVAQVLINVPYFLVNIVVLAGCLIYMGWMSSIVLLGFLCCAGLGMVSYLGPVIVANRKLRVARKHEGKLFDHFDQALEGAKELKLHTPRQRAFIESLFTPEADRVRRLNLSGIALYASAANWNRLLFFLYVGLLVWAAPFINAGGFAGPGAVHLAAYVVVLLYVMAPLEAVMNTMPHLAKADVALRQIQGLLEDLSAQSDTSPDSKSDMGVGAHMRSKVLDCITLRDVSYRYPDLEGEDGFSLGPINLDLRPGECVFLVGGNGSGKTTLLKILTGLYSPCEGSVAVNGEVLGGKQLEDYRNLFSAVFSEFHVFPQLLGHEGQNLDERVDIVLNEMGLQHKVSVENGRLSTVDLSRGQRKRLALLIAMLEDRPCCVFDEWAADQSPEFREKFYASILPHLKRQGKMVLVATHDDRYFHLADRLIKLDEGAITEIERVEAQGEHSSEAGINGAWCQKQRRTALDGLLDISTTSAALPEQAT